MIHADETGTSPALGLTGRLVLLTGLLGLAVPAPAEDNFSATLGLRTGSSTQDIADGFKSTTFHIGPIVDSSATATSA